MLKYNQWNIAREEMIMFKRKIICALLLAALLFTLPLEAFAAQRAVIRLPVKAGLMFVGSEVRLKPRLLRVSAAELTWTSSNPEVVQVQSGRLRGVSAGKAVVTVSGGGAKAKVGVVVLPGSVSMAVGDTVSLPYGGAETYLSKDKSVASVSAKGVITGNAAGETHVQVRYGKQKMNVRVTVKGQDSIAATLSCASETSQIVLVDYQKGSTATLTIHEKQGGVWKQLYEGTAYVGQNGIDKVREGDRRTPTGTFNLTTPFGIKPDPGANMPYTQVTQYHYWCGTSGDPYYNQFIDTRVINRKRTSSDEYLINFKGYYNYCLFIDYNASGEAGKGSCIFLHCIKTNKYTGGCVAVPENVMKKIIQWVKPGAKIVIR